MVFEDLVVVIYPDHVAVHCTPESYDKLLPIFSLWGSGTRIHCCTEKEMEDPDDQEAFKISSFVTMMAGVSAFVVFPGPTIVQ